MTAQHVRDLQADAQCSHCVIRNGFCHKCGALMNVPAPPIPGERSGGDAE